jgi:hypothetical protein
MSVAGYRVVGYCIFLCLIATSPFLQVAIVLDKTEDFAEEHSLDWLSIVDSCFNQITFYFLTVVSSYLFSHSW